MAEEEENTEDLFEEFVKAASSTADHSDDPGKISEIAPEKAEDDPKKDEKPDSIWEGASDEQKAALEALSDEKAQLEHKVKSLEGRVPGLQRQLSKLQQDAKAARVNPADFAKAFTSEASWKEFAEENPEVAAPFEKFMTDFAANVTENMKATEEKQEEIDAKVEEEEAAAADNQITSTHPEWKTWVSTKEWNEWIAKQPPSVSSITTEGSTEDTIWLLGQFGDHLKTIQPSEKESKADSKIADIQEKREKQLKDGTTVSSTDGSATPISNEDTVSLFDFFVKKRNAG